MITIMINTTNAAFDGDLNGEVARILRGLANGLADGAIGDACRLRDTNGNTVGTFRNDVIGES